MFACLSPPMTWNWRAQKRRGDGRKIGRCQIAYLATIPPAFVCSPPTRELRSIRRESDRSDHSVVAFENKRLTRFEIPQDDIAIVARRSHTSAIRREGDTVREPGPGFARA